jgi:hypothetical protein
MSRLCTQVLKVRPEKITISDEHESMLNISKTKLGIDLVDCYELVLVQPV